MKNILVFIVHYINIAPLLKVLFIVVCLQVFSRFEVFQNKTGAKRNSDRDVSGPLGTHSPPLIL